MTAPPSTPALLEWSRRIVPDLAIANEIRDEARVVTARFTFAGERIGLLATNRDDLARSVADTLHELLGLPPLGAVPRDVELERKILLAHLHGDEHARDAFTRDLVLRRPAPFLPTRTSFGKRETW